MDMQERPQAWRGIILSCRTSGLRDSPSITAAKAALHGYVLDLATQLCDQGITANVISPGYVTDSEFFAGRMTPAGHESRVNATLVKRAGTPEDIAEAVRWLAGPGGGYVTGQIINVNGGKTAS